MTPGSYRCHRQSSLRREDLDVAGLAQPFVALRAVGRQVKGAACVTILVATNSNLSITGCATLAGVGGRIIATVHSPGSRNATLIVLGSLQSERSPPVPMTRS